MNITLYILTQSLLLVLVFGLGISMPWWATWFPTIILTIILAFIGLIIFIALLMEAIDN